MSKWYSIRAGKKPAAAGDAKAASAEIFIYGDIGESWWNETTTARDFVRELAAIDAASISVRINSLGGSVPDGIAIYNAIRRHPADVTIYIDGMAMSIASLIAMAGDTVEMAENAVLMIHAPWTGVAGNCAELRAVADMLDTWAEAMSTSYAAKTGSPQAEMLALLMDGKDHFYTAAEALAAGFVDAVSTALPVAASAALPDAAIARYPSASAYLHLQPAAPAAAAHQETAPMPEKITPPEAAAKQPADPKPAEPTKAEILAADQARRDAIRAAPGKFATWAGVSALMAECEANASCTVEQANAKLLAHLGSQATPVAGGHVVTVEDETDKIRGAGVSALLIRAGVADNKLRADNAGNPVRGYKMIDFARASLARAGVRTDGMDQMQIFAAAFTQSTSDFPILLENAMHKALQGAYATAPDTWSRFCATGSVSDFRDHPRYRVGSLGNLESVTELGEFKSKSIPDGEKAVQSIGTKGNIINLSRQAMVNDDLGAFIGLATMLGRSARRTIEADVYALLALNSGMGPTMLDSKTLFHNDHGNTSSASALAVASLDSDRVLMAAQKDVSGNDYLDLRPAVLVVAMSQGGTARVLNAAEYDPDTANKLQRPNMVRGLVRDIVDTPRITGTRRYLFADPTEAPVIEVAFLDGAQEPVLEQENGFTVDGARYKARLDFGVAAIDYRGAVTNAGA